MPVIKIEVDTLPIIKQEDVNQTYVGSAEGCACGCSGDYANAFTPASVRRVNTINENMDNVTIIQGLNETIYELLQYNGKRCVRVYAKKIGVEL